MSKENLRNKIDADITSNGLRRITGVKLNDILNDVVDEMALDGGIIEEGNANAVSGGEVYNNNFIVINNAITNGNFINGLTNWQIDSNVETPVISGDVMTFKGAGNINTAASRVSNSTLTTSSDVLYISLVAKSDNSGTIWFGRGNSNTVPGFTLTNSFKKYSQLSNTASSRFKMGANSNVIVDVKNIQVFNLTQLFGAGNEPTLEFFDKLIGDDIDTYINTKRVSYKKLSLDVLTKAESGYSNTETAKSVKQIEQEVSIILENFNQGNVSNWTAGNNIVSSVTSGVLNFTGNGNPTTTDNQVFRVFADTPSDIIYCNIDAKTNNDASLYIGRGASTSSQLFQLVSDYKRYSTVLPYASTRFKIGANVGGNVDVKSIILINLTKVFGAGKEPTIQYMDELVNNIPYFDRTYTISNKVQLYNINKRIDDIDGNKKLSVLAIGSSFMIDAMLHFPVLAKKAGVDIYVGDLYTGGLDITGVASNCANNTDFQLYGYHNGVGSWNRIATGINTRTVQTILQEREWDIIVLGRGARNSHTWTTEQQTAMFYVLDYIKANTTYNPEILFNTSNSFPTDIATNFTRADQLNRTILINDTTQNMQDNVFLDFIPNDSAVQNARNTFLTNYGSRGAEADLARDELHLDIGIGCYVTGCTMFEKIIKKRFNLSIRNLDYLPTYTDVSGFIGSVSEFTPITEEMAKVAKLCALSANLTPLETSETLPINFPA